MLFLCPFAFTTRERHVRTKCCIAKMLQISILHIAVNSRKCQICIATVLICKQLIAGPCLQWVLSFVKNNRYQVFFNQFNFISLCFHALVGFHRKHTQQIYYCSYRKVTLIAAIVIVNMQYTCSTGKTAGWAGTTSPV